MHNPYKAKLALLAASFVTAGSLAACNSSNPPQPPASPEVSVNPAPPPPPPEVLANPAPPSEPPPEPTL